MVNGEPSLSKWVFFPSGNGYNLKIKNLLQNGVSTSLNSPDTFFLAVLIKSALFVNQATRNLYTKQRNILY